MCKWFHRFKTIFVRDRIKMQDDLRTANQSAEVQFMDDETGSIYYVTTGSLASNAFYFTGGDLFLKNGDIKIRNEDLATPWTVGIYLVEGTPEGALSATQGSLALRRDGGAGTTLYVKESGLGNTGWVAK